MKPVFSITAQGLFFAVCAQEKPLKTPGGQPLAVSSRALAGALTEEWHAQPRFSAVKMPLTSLAYTAIDRIGNQKEQIIEVLLAYVDTDTLSYRALNIPSPLEGEGRVGGGAINVSPGGFALPHPLPPPSRRGGNLAERQRTEWDPILQWAKKIFGVTWNATGGVMPLEQPKALHDAIQKHLQALSGMQLAGLCLLASGFSSLALALAVLNNHIDAAEAFRLSRLEEDAQAEKWGRDAEAESRAQRLKEEMLASERFLRLLEEG